jgi:hypothetical protein
MANQKMTKHLRQRRIPAYRQAGASGGKFQIVENED